MASSASLSCRTFTIKSTMFLFLLISLVTSLQSLAIGRKKRGTVTIGDLPSIRPPTILKNGESKYPNPGWTHCIKYLAADSRWKSIRTVNIKKLQATQFQCSWYISSEVPGSQLKISFEKLDFGGDGSNTCTQQFLELIDIRSGTAQARMCGNKRYGDYVSMGQRVRIDIQGGEPLVAKLRSNEYPFIINYKVVNEPAGFRIGGTSKTTVLKNKVKHTVGDAVDRPTVERGKNIFGSKSQPGANDTPHSDTESDGKPSLTIWQVVIIIVISFALVFCIAGVTIKRMVFDKKKKENYENSDEDTAEDWIKEEKTHELPGFSKVPSASEKRELERNNALDTIWTEKELPRSTSKPETATNTTLKTKRHNSHGDVATKARAEKHQKQSSCYQNIPIPNGVTKNQTAKDSFKHLETELVVDTPLSRAPRENAPKQAGNTTAEPPRTLRHVTKKKQKTDNNDSRVKNHNSDRKKLDNSARKNRGKRTTETERKRKTSEKTLTRTKPTTKNENETSLSRAEKIRPKRSRPKNRRENDQHTKSTTTKRNGETKQKRNDGTRPDKSTNMRKKREHSKGDAKTSGTKTTKTISSKHKKTTASGNTQKTSTHRNRSGNKENSDEKKRHHRKSAKTTLTHTNDANSRTP